MILLHTLILWGVLYCQGQIPKECGTNFTFRTGVCCPTSKNNDQVCGYPERGECKDVKIYEVNVEKFGFEDVRFRWPQQWFQKLCKCKGNFFGPSCDECWYGWKGENCSNKHVVVRRNILNYTNLEKEQFVQVLALLRKKESPYLLVKEAYRDLEESVIATNFHELLVNIHFLAQRPIIRKSAEMCEDVPFFDFAHGNVGFVTYHRHFIMLWERCGAEVAKEDYGIEDFSFPYWDWTDKTECQICTDDLIGAQGERSADGNFYISAGSIFHSWKVYCDLFNPKSQFTVNTCAPCSSSSQSSRITRYVSSLSFPTSEHVKFTLARKSYGPSTSILYSKRNCGDFISALEGVCSESSWSLKHTMHNAVHNDVLGAFSDSSTSPNDPLFVLHHTQIDRLFQRWWISNPDLAKIYPRSVTPGHCFLCNQVGFLPVVRHKRVFCDSRDIGYDYDSLKFGDD